MLSLSFLLKGICSSTNDYFRTATGLTNGYWDNTSTWESSVNGSSGWVASTLVPTNAAKGITVKSGAIVSFLSAVGSYTANKLTIDAGGTLNHTFGSTFTIKKNGANAAVDVSGTYILNGTIPDITTNGAVFQVKANGVVRIDDNISGTGLCDNFIYDNAYKTVFLTDAVFQWNTTNRIEMINGTTFYFINAAIGTSPIFRVSQNLTGANYVGKTPGNDQIQFNGRFEVNSGYTVDFGGNGPKVFRDGVGGAGTLNHKRALTGFYGNCGLFQFGVASGATTPTIYGTVTINIEGISSATDMEVLSNAAVTVTGSPSINIGDATAPNGTLLISGSLTNNASSSINLTNGNLKVTNTVGGTGVFRAGATTTVIVEKTTAGTAGVLSFETGYNTIYDFTMGSSGPLVSSTSSRIDLGTPLVISHNLTLTRGIIVTGTNLLTWNNSGGTLTSPTLASYANSFIATCNANGSALNYSLASPYTGSAGFRINNVGSTIKTFPVGATFLNSGSSFAATPNRMAITNTGTADNFTVVVKKELLVYTPLSGVNRVWYVSEGTPGGSNVTMNLYFTKRNWSTSAYPSVQDEIETGFIYSDPHLIQKNYNAVDNEFVSNSLLGLPPTGDVPTYTAASFDDKEISAQYRNGISPDLSGNTNGIKEFGRFSVFNAAGIVLPVSITNIKAYQKGNEVQVEWQAFNELNVNRYEIEKSADAANFSKIATVTARNNGNASNNYIATDVKPSQGKNFYRIKAIDNDGKIAYTQIVAVDISNGRKSISVVPNPVINRYVNLQLNNLAAAKYNLILYSIEGKIVYSKLIEHAGGSSSQQIGLPSGVAFGTYILKVFSESENYKERILVQ